MITTLDIAGIKPAEDRHLEFLGKIGKGEGEFGDLHPTAREYAARRYAELSASKLRGRDLLGAVWLDLQHLRKVTGNGSIHRGEQELGRMF